MAKVEVGDAAPDFTLPGTGGREYRLSDYRGRPVVLAFYPGDDTRVCTAQFCAYSNDMDDLSRLGVELLGISPQSVASHERWARRHGITVPLLADAELAVSRRYGVTGWAGPVGTMLGVGASGGRYVKRAVFLVDDGGVVRHRRVSRTGLSYESTAEIESAVESIR
ncbi:MAG TPA: peroxiredoxin [Planctomycetaceae bacterium]